MSKDPKERDSGASPNSERGVATADEAARRLIADAQQGFARNHDGNNTALLNDVEAADRAASKIADPTARRVFMSELNRKLEDSGILPVIAADFGLEYQQILNGSNNGQNGNEKAPITKQNIDDALKLADSNPNAQVQAMLLQNIQGNWNNIQNAHLNPGEKPLIQGNDSALVAYETRSWTKYEQSALLGDNGLVTPPTDKMAFQQQLQALFPRLDTNGDGKITDDDLNKAMADGAFTGKDAAVLFTLKLNEQDFFPSLGDVSGFTMKDIADKFGQNFNFGSKDSPSIENVGDHLFGKAVKGFNELNQRIGLPLNDRSIFPNSDCISIDAINQGMQGDCYFLSSLGALAKENPDAIKRMITNNNDGTYTVKFPGLSDPIVVSPPSETEFTDNARISKYGTWAPLMEKAWQSYRTHGIPDAQDNGALPKEPMEALTGHKYDYYILPTATTPGGPRPITAENEQATESIVKYAIEHHQPITAGTEQGSVYSLPQLKNDHNYSVVGFDGSSNPPTIELRNPYGVYEDGNPSADAAHGVYPVPGKPGYFKLSVAQFCRNFRQICYDTNDY